MHIDGEFNGDIHSTNTVSIGKSSVVKCELKAHKLIVAGKFYGNAECEFIELLSSGEVEGQLTAASLAIDSGGSFQGQSIRKKPGDYSKVVDFAADPDSTETTSTNSPGSP